MLTRLVLVAAVAAVLAACSGTSDDGEAAARRTPDGSPPPNPSTTTTTTPPTTTTSTTTTPPTTTTSTTTTSTTDPPTTLLALPAPRVVHLDLVDGGRPTIAAGGHPGAPHRELPTTVYLPVDRQPAPLVVLAHGAGGTPEKFTHLASYWSDAGYVVAVPRFPLSNGTVPDPYIGDIVEQGRDVSFVIDQVLELNADPSDDLGRRIDPEHIGLFGLSLGSLTMWTTLFGSCCGDPRVDALIQSDGAIPFPIERLAEVTFPVMIAHSDADAIFPYELTRAEFDALPGPRYLLTLHGAVHAAVAENTVTPADLALQQATTVFWDRHLRGRAATEFPAGVRIDGVTTFEP